MDVVVVIPFRGDEGILRWVLDGFARQRLPEGVRVRVRVGGDGCLPPAAPPPGEVARGVAFEVMELPRVGNSQAKNLLLEGVEGSEGVVIFGNADTRPAEDMVARHVARLRELPSGSIVLGAAPFEATASPTVFDALKWETPAIFFYCQMAGEAWYDYRHAWTLNMAMRLADFRAAGGFSTKLFPYGYEDLELAYRVMGTQRKGVFYDDAIGVVHRHPMTFEQYLMREEMLGLMGPVVHRIAPGMFEHLFGTRDIERLAGEFRTWVGMDAAGHKWTYKRVMAWADLPATELGEGQRRTRVLDTIYQMHIPLKRLAFRLGFLRGMELVDDQRKGERRAVGAWKRVVEA